MAHRHVVPNSCWFFWFATFLRERCDAWVLTNSSFKMTASFTVIGSIGSTTRKVINNVGARYKKHWFINITSFILTFEKNRMINVTKFFYSPFKFLNVEFKIAKSWFPVHYWSHTWMSTERFTAILFKAMNFIVSKIWFNTIRVSFK